MALSINTNISSLTAQRAIADSKNDLETAMERLATGSKINSASDDAAGLAMTQRMTAQIQGLNMAIKNSNDGIAMTKSIEGAIAEVSDMLQRMRELSIQAANGTNSASDRTYLQDEVNLLIQEVTRVSANTRYNGTLILDGTFINKQLQVGIEEGEHITFSVDSVASKQIGAHTLIGNGNNPQTPSGTPPTNPVSTNEDIEIFGYLGTRTVEASSEDSAKETQTKVNLLTHATGVKAYAKTYAALSSGDDTARTYNLKVNGFQTGNFIISSTDVGDAVEAINRISGASGVTAKVESNKVILFDADGDDIFIENTKTGDEFVDLVVEKLGEDGLVSSVIGQPIRLGAGATSTNAEATFTQTHGTLSNYANGTHTISDGTTTLSITRAGGTPSTADLVSDFRSSASYESFKYDISANGTTGFTFTAREPGVIQAAEQPILAAAAAVVDAGTLTSGVVGASADSTRISGSLKFVSSHSFSVEQAGPTKAVFSQTHGTLSNYANGTHTLSDGKTTLSITVGSATPTTAELVSAFTSASGFDNFKYDIASDGTSGFTFTAKEAGSIRAADQPVLSTSPEVAKVDIADVYSAYASWKAGGPAAAGEIVTSFNGDTVTLVLNHNTAQAGVAAGNLGNDLVAGTFAAAFVAAYNAHAGSVNSSAAASGEDGASAGANTISFTQTNTGSFANSNGLTVTFDNDTSSAGDGVTAIGGNPFVFSNGAGGAGAQQSNLVIAGVPTGDSGALNITTPGDANGYFADGSQTASLVDLTQISISSEGGASDAISIIDAALDKVAQMRSDLGAIENRMDHTISNLMNIAEKTADSRSRLEDADFALESARLAKNQVLQQAGTSMLSQANQMSQLVMELLRG
jgi:flagellin